MNEMLFKLVEQRHGPQTARETTFEFLQRGGRKEAVEIRQWIESWFQAIPDNRKKGIEKRLTSRHFEQFLAAMFELEIHEILRRLGCIIEIEPELPSGGTVDFHVIDKAQEFYMEATVCGIGQGTLHPNENEYDAVEKLRSHLKKPLHSELWLSAKGELKRSLGKEVVKPFQNLLDKHSPEEVRNIHGQYGPQLGSWFLSTEFREGDWTLEGRLKPAFASSRDGQVRGPARGGPVDGVKPITTALKKKVKNWKEGGMRDHIFLIAINVCHSDSFPDDPERAIFGLGRASEKEGHFREDLSCVNGVIVFYNATLGNEHSAPVRLYKNGNRAIPECLHFLLQERRLGDLLGIDTQESKNRGIQLFEDST